FGTVEDEGLSHRFLNTVDADLLFDGVIRRVRKSAERDDDLLAGERRVAHGGFRLSSRRCAGEKHESERRGDRESQCGPASSSNAGWLRGCVKHVVVLLMRVQVPFSAAPPTCQSRRAAPGARVPSARG